jgi:hypothetical protein
MFKRYNWIKRAAFVALAAGAALFASVHPAAGVGTAPSLDAAASFAVLGGSTVTNTGATTIGGDIGVSPGSAITTDTTFTFLNAGTQRNAADSLAAQNAVTAAETALGSQGCDATGTALAGTLAPGVYCYTSSASLPGTVTLDALGNPGAVFIFKTVSTLTTATGSTVALTDGAQPCNVFWKIGSSADLFTNTTFVGNIIAYASINLQNGASVSGRALARTGAVTMDHNQVLRPKTCAAGATPTASPPGTTPTATPTAAAATATPPPGATPTATPPAATPTASPPGATPTRAATATPPPGATPTASVSTATPTAPPPGATPTASPPGATPTAPTTAMPTRATPGATPTASTATPTTRPVPGLPGTGGAPPQGGGFPWFLVLVASVVASLALGLSVRTYQGHAR